MHEGNIGMKTGRGFLDYEKLDLDRHRLERLAAFAALLRDLGLVRRRWWIMVREPLDADRIFARRSVASPSCPGPGGEAWDQAARAVRRQSWSLPTRRSLRHAPPVACMKPAFGRAIGLLLICENRPEFIEIFLGTAWLGAILVPINTASAACSRPPHPGEFRARLLVIEAA